MPALVRITDSTTVPELLECMSLLPREAWDARRETLIDTLWAEVLVRREGARA